MGFGFLRRSAAPGKGVLFDREGDLDVWSKSGMRRRLRFREAEAIGEGGLAGVEDRAGGRAGVRRCVCR